MEGSNAKGETPVISITDRRTASGAPKAPKSAPQVEPEAPPSPVPAPASDEAITRRALVAEAMGALNEAADFLARGRGVRTDRLAKAFFGSILMADRNTHEFEARLRWLEHSWVWRMFHRSRRPMRAVESIKQ